MKLFVDDVRPAPNGFVLARTITKAVRILATAPEPIELVSLDHDIFYVTPELAITPDETFETVARYIAVLNYVESLKTDPYFIFVTCHSGNPCAAGKYESILGDKFLGQKSLKEIYGSDKEQ